jgi:DNA mismatch repair protein MutL
LPEPVPPAGSPSGTSPSTATRSEIRNLRILGTLSTLYLVAESDRGLVLIDQHAAHERILFEKLLRAMRAREPERQPLLLPVTVEFAPPDAALLRRSLEHFQHLGFGLDEFGGNTFIATAVPVRFPRENLAGFLHDVLEELRQGGPNPASRPDEVQIAQAACKHAVKAEDPLKPEEIAQLLTDLAAVEMPYTCPHGRPVMITIPHAEIERRFGRRV